MKKYLNADDRGFSSRMTADLYPRKSAFNIIRVNQRSIKISQSAQKGITLLELLIAISLLLLVLAAAMSVDMAGQWFFKSTSVQAEIQDELQPAIEHIVKNIQLANGINLVSQTEVRVRIDDNNTPTNFSDDTWVTYEKSSENVLYSDTDKGITDEVIAKGITNNDIFSLSGIFLTIKLVGQRVIQETPEITESTTLISGATLRCSATIL